ncbi:MAG: RNA polymerase sigma factor [Thermomicrobiales bacterium]|nr:RNA polymerase sigma factor [Thermomicrobiales bacterium]
MDLLEEVFARHRQDLFHFCYRRLGSIEAAQDACGRIVLKAINNIDSFEPHPDRPGETMRAWLFRIARNDLIDSRRAWRPIRSLDVSEPGFVEPTDPRPGPETTALQREAAHELQAVLQQLPETQRNIIELRLAGLRGDEIASTLGLTLSAVKSAQYRAYARLRDLLSNHESR